MLIHTAHEIMTAELYDPLAITEEISSLARSNGIEIIIEIKILLIKIFNPVKMHFDRIAIEGREILIWNNILVEYNLEIVTICPLWYL
jgi:hypothetical protein